MSTPLRVVVSASCPACDRALTLAEEVRRVRPGRSVELVDVGEHPELLPPTVIGTPTWLLGDSVVSLGNPALEALLATLDAAGSDR